MARSLKHTKNFKYTRHNQHFEHLEQAGNKISELRAAGITQIMSPKSLLAIRHSRGRVVKISGGYRLRWYTRELIGDKV